MSKLEINFWRYCLTISVLAKNEYDKNGYSETIDRYYNYCIGALNFLQKQGLSVRRIIDLRRKIDIEFLPIMAQDRPTVVRQRACQT